MYRNGVEQSSALTCKKCRPFLNIEDADTYIFYANKKRMATSESFVSVSQVLYPEHVPENQLKNVPDSF